MLRLSSTLPAPASRPLSSISQPTFSGWEDGSSFALPADRFTRSTGVQLVHPTFAKQGLKAFVAIEADLPAITELINTVQDRIYEDQPYTRRNREDRVLLKDPIIRTLLEELAEIRRDGLDTPVEPIYEAVESRWPAAWTEQQSLKTNLTQALREEYLDNPHAALIVLKNDQGQVVGLEGIRQFQDTLVFQGKDKGLDSKHGYFSDLHVAPNYRGRGLAKALKDTALVYARKQLDYRYIWSTTEEENPSHHLNVNKLGFTPLDQSAQFSDTPALTPDKIKELIEEYNTGSLRLCWRAL